MKPYKIWHWDTFDNETLLIDEADDLDQANEIVLNRYGTRIDSCGADQVDIVDSKGNIVKKYNVR